MKPFINRIFIAMSLIGVLNNAANAQVFNIRSLDGKSCHINVLVNGANGSFYVSYLKDTIHIKDLNDLTKITRLTKNFLKIDYDARGGTGLHIEKTLIVTVDHQKLLQPLYVVSLFHEEFIDFSKPVDTSNEVEIRSTYKLRFALTGDTTPNYKLNVKIHDERKTKHHPRTNYVHDDEAILIFDPGKGTFCNAHKNISQYFTVFDPKNQKETKRYIKGAFPEAKLGKSRYYFIKDAWYEESDNHHLSKYSYN